MELNDVMQTTFAAREFTDDGVWVEWIRTVSGEMLTILVDGLRDRV